MKRSTSILLPLLVIAGLFGAARLNEPLRDARREYGISQADPLVNAPPLVAFSTVALGGFRGIVADILWMRSARLQDEGRYFELVQLADWITKLEPRFTDVWAFHAWNLSYNISVLLKQPEERWRWVSSGISLLRDEGLRYNPGDARLLYELGWLFQHKLAGNTDSANMYYKQAWAAEMAELWNGPTPDFDFLIANPNDPRAQRLRDRYKMDPAAMREIDQRYGPLDWRLPQAHAIYWAWQSRALAKKRFRRDFRRPDDFPIPRRRLSPGQTLHQPRATPLHPLPQSRSHSPRHRRLRRRHRPIRRQRLLQNLPSQLYARGHRRLIFV
ncbi:MAG: hypothetical protein M5U15_14925 [Kiritimatiellae bacterium]|nr:hypothetical protein [Kiritimatiellia bacterium]